MNINEAKKIIKEGSRFTKLIEASNEITNLKEPSFEDLLACLKHPGLPTELAVMKLYFLTNRKRKDDSIDSLIMDYYNWQDYLLKNKYIKK